MGVGDRDQGFDQLPNISSGGAKGSRGSMWPLQEDLAAQLERTGSASEELREVVDGAKLPEVTAGRTVGLAEASSHDVDDLVRRRVLVATEQRMLGGRGWAQGAMCKGARGQHA